MVLTLLAEGVICIHLSKNLQLLRFVEIEDLADEQARHPSGPHFRHNFVQHII